MAEARAIYLNQSARDPVNGAAREFLRFLLSHEGQQIVAADGNIPLDAPTIEQGRRALTE